jgi:hypothetical protein
MALVVYDRVQQTGTANTTVSFTLSGSVTGFQSFSVVGNGNTTYYAATDASGNWEVGLGTYSTTGPTLTRTTILSSSNSNTAVTFSGTCNVFVTYPSSTSVYEDTSGNVSPLGTITSGTWNATTIGAAYGGTGLTSSGTSGNVLTSNGTAWVSQAPSNAYTRTSFTASAAQTTFTVTYTVGLIEIFVNGVLLNGADYTATNGTSVVLAVACNSGDIVETLAFSAFSVASTVSSFSGGTTGLTPSSAATGIVTLAGTLAVANGGTGVTTSTGSGAVVLGTSPTLSSPAFSGTPSGVGVLTSGTSQASTSGTTIPFTGIPSWVKRITVMFSGVSTSGSSLVIVQLGSTTYTTSGYANGGGGMSGASVNSNGSVTAGLLAGGTTQNTNTDLRHGTVTLTQLTGNTWVSTSIMGSTATDFIGLSGGSIALGGVLDRVQVTTVNGTDTFDAGSINILYE